jgi:hypothetical protein
VAERCGDGVDKVSRRMVRWVLSWMECHSVDSSSSIIECSQASLSNAAKQRDQAFLEIASNAAISEVLHADIINIHPSRLLVGQQ